MIHDNKIAAVVEKIHRFTISAFA